MCVMATWRNWARTEHATPRAFDTPRSADEVAAVVTRAAERGDRVKAVGAGHSFTGAAVTDGVLVSLDGVAGIERVEPTATGALVTVGAGTRLHELNRLLWSHGLALANLGDIDVQSIAGAVSTGTHGTGAGFGGLATQVCAATVVLADGRTVHCSPTADPELFEAVRLGVGSVGILTSLTLDCVHAFRLRATEAPATLTETLTVLDDDRLAVDHFEFYWFPHTDRVLTKRNIRIEGAEPTEPVGRVRGFVDDELLSNGVFGALQHVGTRAPGLIPRINEVAGRVLSPREFTDRSYAVFASPRRVRFREMEYAIPVAALPGVLADIARGLERTGRQVAFPVEVRFAAADDVWLSTAHGRDTAYVAVHEFHRRDHRDYFATVEEIVRGVDGRPHWGKLHTRTADDLRPAYPRFDDFLAVRERVDPNGMFVNSYLERVFGTRSKGALR